MLKIKLTDKNGREVPDMSLRSLHIVFSEDAPAVSMTAVLIPGGRIQEIYCCEAEYNGERLFSGSVDEQIEEHSGKGHFLTLRARSREAVLLDNEAMPQTYNMPCFGLIFERHFRPLGFTGFCGTDEVFNGELTVTKGMSQWSVLSAFCRSFTGTTPRVNDDGIIDISGSSVPGRIHIDRDIIITLKNTLRRSAPVSRILARTFVAGGYNMEFQSKRSKELGIEKTRYVNALGDGIRGIGDIRRLMERSERAYDTMELRCTGIIKCCPGDILTVGGKEGEYIIRDVSFSADSKGERTTIKAEVNNNVA